MKSTLAWEQVQEDSDHKEGDGVSQTQFSDAADITHLSSYPTYPPNWPQTHIVAGVQTQTSEYSGDMGKKSFLSS